MTNSKEIIAPIKEVDQGTCLTQGDPTLIETSDTTDVEWRDLWENVEQRHVSRECEQAHYEDIIKHIKANEAIEKANQRVLASLMEKVDDNRFHLSWIYKAGLLLSVIVLGLVIKEFFF